MAAKDYSGHVLLTFEASEVLQLPARPPEFSQKQGKGRLFEKPDIKAVTVVSPNDVDLQLS